MATATHAQGGEEEDHLYQQEVRQSSSRNSKKESMICISEMVQEAGPKHRPPCLRHADAPK